MNISVKYMVQLCLIVKYDDSNITNSINSQIGYHMQIFQRRYLVSKIETHMCMYKIKI